MGFRYGNNKLTGNQIREKTEQLRQHRFGRCNRPDIKVACILDTFSYDCFKYECSLVQLHAKTWKEQLEKEQPDFLFVESAWRGVDSSWKRLLYNLSEQPASPIYDVIEYCKNNRIKTIFWNKEDPPHYDRFIETAKLFDIVFTTDKNCVKRYKRDLGHDNIYVMPFAAQPMIHNPVHSNYHTKENVAFAGTWHRKKYPHRKEDMAVTLQPAREYNLHIFDRKYKYSDRRFYAFPVEYQPNIIGSLPYKNMVEAYKLYKVFLNVNSVKQSPTMFSRRVFEILASGTNVISSYSKGIENLFAGIVPLTRSTEETHAYLSELLQDGEKSQRLSLLGIRKTHQQHLYRHRFNLILKKLDYTTEEPKGVSVLAYINRPDFLENVYKNFENQAWKAKELVVLYQTDKSDVTMDTWVERLGNQPHISMYVLPEEVPFADCLRFAVEKSRYNFLSILHAEDYYARHFLTDLMHAFDYTDAHIVGKRTHYAFSEFQHQLMLCFPDQENQYVTHLTGAAMVIKKDVFSHVCLRENCAGGYQEFLTDCIRNGFKLYAADKYNYIRVRKSEWDQDELLDEEERFISDSDEYLQHVTV